uniref:Uncharacterized protein n=1 Tax=Knipowitschia caucasica TaxID=637954 RepID=A0AAV2MQR3_KNICA
MPRVKRLAQVTLSEGDIGDKLGRAICEGPRQEECGVFEEVGGVVRCGGVEGGKGGGGGGGGGCGKGHTEIIHQNASEQRY